jgi:F420H(2)-dependent quinone reductase
MPTQLIAPETGAPPPAPPASERPAPIAPPGGPPPGEGGPPAWMQPLIKAANPLIVGLLRSPLHRLLSYRILVLSFRGRTTGRRFTLPVSYERQGATLLVYTRHGWWKNLRGGVPVQVVLRGHTLDARAEAVTDPAEVTAAVTAYIAGHGPAQAWQIAVALAPDRVPTPATLAAAAQGLVLVRIHLPGVP